MEFATDEAAALRVEDEAAGQIHDADPRLARRRNMGRGGLRRGWEIV
jgi:hypothetical protein